VETDVRVIDPRTERRWDAFVLAHPLACVFHTSEWCRVLADTYGYHPRYIAAFDSAGDIRAAVPMMLIDSWLTSRRLVGLPFSDMCQPLVSDDAYGLLALTGAQDQVNKMSAASLELRGPGVGNAKDLGFSNGTNFLRHIIDLDAVTEAMEARVHQSARRAIRKAEREGLTVRLASDIDSMHAFYRLMVLTRRKHGLLPQPKSFFQNLHQHMFESGAGYLLLAEYEGRPVAGDLLLRFRDELVYKFNASDPDFLHLRPNNLLLWNAMLTGAALGCRTLDLGRCDEENEGLRRFKLLWGSREETLSYYYYPQNNRNGLLTGGIARDSLALFVKYAPLAALRGMGSALYRNFG